MADTADPARLYGVFVDWDARLGREAPFFRQRFEAEGVRTVIDVGAGSGRHAIMFATWGLDVVAVDPSESMLAEASGNLERFSDDVASGGGSVVLREGGFGQLSGLAGEQADALVCTGNALPHVEGAAGLRSTLDDFAAVLRSGGLLILHLLNHRRLLERRPRAMVPKVRETDEGTHVFLRIFEYPDGDEVIAIDFLTLARAEDGEWSVDGRRSEHTAMPPAMLADEVARAGFGDVELLGDHSGRLLDEESDESVILVARRL